MRAQYRHREVVGSLMYLDVSYAVGVVSRFLSNLKETHVNAVKRFLKYLRGTIDYGIIFEKILSTQCFVTMILMQAIPIQDDRLVAKR